MNGKLAALTAALPEDVGRALGDAGLAAAFARLPPSHRPEYLTWIEGAKQAATRARRVAGMVQRLQAG